MPLLGARAGARVAGTVRTEGRDLRGQSNLPLALTSFVGRAAEVERVAGLLLGARLLTLTGTGGIGKTRLALRVAEHVAANYEDGTWLVELAALGEPALVPHAVAAALGVRERPDMHEVRDVLLEELSTRHLLLILDNCEHLLGGCADLVHALLRACPRLTILATSRQSLGIAGEITWPVPPLGLPDPRAAAGTDELARYEAVSLFLERARLVVPDLHLGDRNAATIVQICRQLDGIPLAIELAAARTRSLALEHIASRLQDRFRLLTGASHGTVARQQTLRNAVEWSYELLDATERAVFRALGVFAGGFSLEAAEHVLPEPADAIDILSQLVDKSLVLVEHHDGQARYRLLETLRQFALEQAGAADQLSSTRDRHLAWFVDLAERADQALHGPDQAAALTSLDQEQDNIRAALGWAVEAPRTELGVRLAVGCAYYWEIRGHRFRVEARGWLDQLLDQPGATETAHSARALNWSATFAAELFDFPRAAVRFGQARAAAERAADAGDLAEALLGLGNMRRLQGLYDEARTLLEASLALNQQRADELGQAHVLRQLGALARDTGAAPTADARNAESLALFRAHGEAHQAGHLLDQVGEAARDLGHFERALEAHQRGFEHLEAAGCEEGVKSSLSHLALLALARGDAPHAFELALDSLRLGHAIGMRRHVPTCLELVANLCAADDPRRAARLLGAAEAMRATMGTVCPPADAALARDAELAGQRALGAAQWQAARASGRAHDLGQAVRDALEAPPPGPSEGPLSAREREVAVLIGRGLSNREISDALVLSVRTTEAHVTHVLAKLGLRSRAQLAVWAVEHGLVERSGPGSQARQRR